MSEEDRELIKQLIAAVADLTRAIKTVRIPSDPHAGKIVSGGGHGGYMPVR